jgi:limonene-1,2-epoxide hydrolase
LIVTFADVDSLERLAAVAADGARQFRERIEARAAGHGQHT